MTEDSYREPRTAGMLQRRLRDCIPLASVMEFLSKQGGLETRDGRPYGFTVNGVRMIPGDDGRTLILDGPDGTIVWTDPDSAYIRDVMADMFAEMDDTGWTAVGDGWLESEDYDGGMFLCYRIRGNHVELKLEDDDEQVQKLTLHISLWNWLANAVEGSLEGRE